MPSSARTPAVRFGYGGVASQESDAEILQRYHINTDNVPVFNLSGSHLNPRFSPDHSISDKEKTEIIAWYLRAHELAKINAWLGNPWLRKSDGEFLGAALKLRNGIWALGGNIEAFKEITTTCAERNAFTNAWTQTAIRQIANIQKSQSQGLAANENQAKHEVIEGLKAKYLIVATNQLGRYLEPCFDCDDLLSSPRYFDPETRVISLKRGSNGQLSMYVQTLEDRLGLWFKRQSSMFTNLPPYGSVPPTNTDRRFAPDPSRMSEQAGAVLKRLPVGYQNVIQQMMFKAYRQFMAYDQRPPIQKPYELSAAAAVKFYGDPNIYTMPLLHIKRRTVIAPEILATAMAHSQYIQQNVLLRRRPLEAVAYYSNNPYAMRVVNMGALIQPSVGSQDTLVAVIENNQVVLRTMRDYLPFAKLTGQEYAVDNMVAN